jgi:phospho-N-acetylmuramoyl-pentapeptide-transferase
MSLVMRALGALMTSWFMVWVSIPFFTRWIHRMGSQPIRTDGPLTHLQTKQGKATMGGVVLVASMAISSVIFTGGSSPFVWLAMAVCCGFALIGGIDDWCKIRQQNTKGLSPRTRMMAMSFVAVSAGAIAQSWLPSHVAWGLALPWSKTLLWSSAGASLYALWSLLVVAGSANAVNLTDGLDGLAIVSIMGCALVLGYGAYLSGVGFTGVIDMAGAEELSVLCASIIGSCLAFAWYNAMPSTIIMGDVGSLALGGTLGFVALLVKQEWILGIAGGIFVLETLSVVLQVVWFRRTGKRLFRMAPIHHHFELKGWSEGQVVFRFSMITALLCVMALGWLLWGV